MSICSNVRMLMSNKAYELLKTNCLKNSPKSIKMVNEPSIFKKHDKNSILIGWDDIEWYFNFQNIKTVMKTMDELDQIVKDNPKELKQYFYKVAKVEENTNCTSYYTNDENDIFTSDLYVEACFSIQ